MNIQNIQFYAVFWVSIIFMMDTRKKGSLDIHKQGINSYTEPT